jgi:hypothetical protein
MFFYNRKAEKVAENRPQLLLSEIHSDDNEERENVKKDYKIEWADHYGTKGETFIMASSQEEAEHWFRDEYGYTGNVTITPFHNSERE